MTEPIKPMVVDLSHWDPASDYAAVKGDGFWGVIYKATQGGGYTDPTYVGQRGAARAAGLKWGAYHFADGSDTQGQIDNFLSFASPDPDELFCLDWEDNPGGTKLSVSQAKDWISGVEGKLGRPGECVIYGGNTLKEMIQGKDEFFGSRRLWLCQYGSSPSLPSSWSSYWLWQFTDGASGPSPHSVSGIGPCDINSYKLGPPEQLVAEWASGSASPEPSPEPEGVPVEISVTAPDNVSLSIKVNGKLVAESNRVARPGRLGVERPKPGKPNRKSEAEAEG
jgi:lysozyme